MKTIRDLDLKQKRVLVRVDYNVPMNAEGGVEDDSRIRETLPTLRFLIEKHAKVILASHLGRPKGKVDPRFSLKPAAVRLEALLGKKVLFAEDCVGGKVEEAVSRLHPGDVLLLENVRFHPEEEKNGEAFARALASLADFYVNDAFGAAHRPHASTTGVAKFLPSAAGFLLEKEVRALSHLLVAPTHPYFVVLGGAKVSDKLGVLKNLIPRVDAVFVGGAMAFTFLKSLGYKVGKSLVEEDWLLQVSQLYNQHPGKIYLPFDVVAAPSLELPEERRPVTLSKDENTMDDLQGLDIGPETLKRFAGVIAEEKPKTVFWNGPMGVFEVKEFSAGTLEVGKMLGNCARHGANVVVGGGDSVSAVHQLNLASEMSHLSTGGGASLEFLEGKALPGIVSLESSGHPVGR